MQISSNLEIDQSTTSHKNRTIFLCIYIEHNNLPEVR